MSLIHQLQTNVPYLRLTGMSSGFVRAGTERPVPPLPVSRPIRAHYSFVKFKRAAPAVNNRVPPAAANKTNGKVGFCSPARPRKARPGSAACGGGGGAHPGQPVPPPLGKRRGLPYAATTGRNRIVTAALSGGGCPGVRPVGRSGAG